MATSAPAVAKALAIAPPIAPEPPVTNATLPLRSIVHALYVQWPCDALPFNALRKQMSRSTSSYPKAVRAQKLTTLSISQPQPFGVIAENNMSHAHTMTHLR